MPFREDSSPATSLYTMGIFDLNKTSRKIVFVCGSLLRALCGVLTQVSPQCYCFELCVSLYVCLCVCIALARAGTSLIGSRLWHHCHSSPSLSALRASLSSSSTAATTAATVATAAAAPVKEPMPSGGAAAAEATWDFTSPGERVACSCSRLAPPRTHYPARSWPLSL